MRVVSVKFSPDCFPERIRLGLDSSHLDHQMAVSRNNLNCSGSFSSPTFTRPLRDVYIALGEPVTLECCVRGYPIPHVWWERSGRKIGSSRQLHIERSGEKCRLHIKSTSINEKGKYCCFASNKAGSSQTTANVFLNEKSSTLSRGGRNEYSSTTRRALSPVKPTRTPSPCEVRSKLVCGSSSSSPKPLVSSPRVQKVDITPTKCQNNVPENKERTSRTMHRRENVINSAKQKKAVESTGPVPSATSRVKSVKSHKDSAKPKCTSVLEVRLSPSKMVPVSKTNDFSAQTRSKVSTVSLNSVSVRGPVPSNKSSNVSVTSKIYTNSTSTSSNSDSISVPISRSLPLGPSNKMTKPTVKLKSLHPSTGTLSKPSTTLSSRKPQPTPIITSTPKHSDAQNKSKTILSTNKPCSSVASEQLSIHQKLRKPTGNFQQSATSTSKQTTTSPITHLARTKNVLPANCREKSSSSNLSSCRPQKPEDNHLISNQEITKFVSSGNASSLKSSKTRHVNKQDEADFATVKVLKNIDFLESAANRPLDDSSKCLNERKIICVDHINNIENRKKSGVSFSIMPEKTLVDRKNIQESPGTTELAKRFNLRSTSSVESNTNTENTHSSYDFSVGGPGRIKNKVDSFESILDEISKNITNKRNVNDSTSVDFTKSKTTVCELRNCLSDESVRIRTDKSNFSSNETVKMGTDNNRPLLRNSLSSEPVDASVNKLDSYNSVQEEPVKKAAENIRNVCKFSFDFENKPKLPNSKESSKTIEDKQNMHESSFEVSESKPLHDNRNTTTEHDPEFRSNHKMTNSSSPLTNDLVSTSSSEVKNIRSGDSSSNKSSISKSKGSPKVPSTLPTASWLISGPSKSFSQSTSSIPNYCKNSSVSAPATPVCENWSFPGQSDVSEISVAHPSVLTKHSSQHSIRRRPKAPEFLLPPRSKVVNEGEGVRFLCSAVGCPEPTVVWQYNGRDLSSGDNITVSQKESLHTLEIRPVKAQDAGKYVVKLKNSLGTAEAFAYLEVRVLEETTTPPKVIRPLNDGTAEDEKPYTLSCEVTGAPPPSVRWYKDGKPLKQSQDFKLIFDGQTATLAIKEVFPEDEGEYECVAKNNEGEVKTSCILMVKENFEGLQQVAGEGEPPVFTQTLEDLEVIDGASVTLTVRVKGTPPIEITWVHNYQEIKNCSDFRYVSSPDGITHNLVIADIFPEDAGLYTCEAYNVYGGDETNCKLSVKERFTENGHASHQECAFGHASHQERAFCLPELSTELYNKTTNGVRSPRISTPRKEVNDAGERPQSVTTLQCKEPPRRNDSKALIKTAVYRTESGRIRQRPPVETNGNFEAEQETECFPPTVNRSGRSKMTAFPRLTPAQILKGPQSVAVLVGDTITLRAHFVGSPPPSVTWIKGGKILKTDERKTIERYEGLSVVTIKDLVADDSGKYVVAVENSGGSDCHFASVAVEGPPDPPAGKPNVSDVTSHSLVLSWYGSTFDGGSIITGYIVEMCTLPDKKWSRITAACHSTSYVVRDLLSERRYAFRVRAENVHGVSEPSKESEPVFITENLDMEDEEDFKPLNYPEVQIEEGCGFYEHFDLKEEVGKGRFGTVYRCIEKSTGIERAAKIVRCVKSKDKEKVREEINVMNKLRHPKLLQLTAAYENTKETVLVMEYISGGELFERVIADDFVLTERDCILFMRQICDGVRYMHENNVIHLDLKPENILCKTQTSHQIKLIDFGLAREYSPNGDLRVLFGTPEFVAPEIISYEPVSPLSDMWSVGVICYVLLSGLSPFMGENDAETFTNITKAEFDFEDEAFDAITQDAKDFISQLLVKRPNRRLTAEQCLSHKWLKLEDRKTKSVQLPTDKLKKFIIRRKWQKTGNAIRALGRMVTLSGVSASRSSVGSSSGYQSSYGSLSDSDSSLSSVFYPSKTIKENVAPWIIKEQVEEEAYFSGDNCTKNDDFMDSQRGSKSVNGEKTSVRMKKTLDQTLRKVRPKTDGKDSSSFEAPYFIKKMKNELQVREGGRVRLEVQVDGNPEPSVAWFIGDKRINTDSRHREHRLSNGVYALEIDNCCQTDRGEYICVIKNNMGEQKCRGSLTILKR
ncbi:twitchin-like isoform X2 [Tachypleus tridentatus]|uniref:twitchin-like isoform X2 n=1 Tax=Tachypleus tridentatus TaxID=6853 RepID=UPI003FD39073